LEDEEELMEERRLLYVGITRAKDRLYLVYPQKRSSYGYAEPVEPSRFLADIPNDLLIEEGETRRDPLRTASFRPDRWDSPGTPKAPRVTRQQYHPGMRVIHSVWGEGMVLNSKLQDDDEIVDIYFEKLGLKRVAASIAKLEIKGS
jgi:DNA helicase-2/ATP-dependent DNA helicase PcrA